MKDITELGYLPSFKMKLSSKKLENLGWYATKDIGDMLDSMIYSMEEAVDPYYIK